MKEEKTQDRENPRNKLIELKLKLRKTKEKQGVASDDERVPVDIREKLLRLKMNKHKPFNAVKASPKAKRKVNTEGKRKSEELRRARETIVEE